MAQPRFLLPLPKPDMKFSLIRLSPGSRPAAFHEATRVGDEPKHPHPVLR